MTGIEPGPCDHVPAASPVPTTCAPAPSPQPRAPHCHSAPAPLLPNVTHVTAAVLRDAQGRVLLSQRSPKGDLAGLWEFPGGKREPGEDSQAALQRELREELGIDASQFQPLIEVPHAYPHKRIVLEVFTAQWAGEPTGCEGQALRWVWPESLAGMQMPSADRPVVAALTQPDRYLITPDSDADFDPFLRSLGAALVDGVFRVQLRAASLSSASMWALAEAVDAQCRRAGAVCLINSGCVDAYEIAHRLGCGLHLTSAHLAQATQRPWVADRLLAASCHNASELAKAQALGCEFAVLGPVTATATHPNAEAMGWSNFRALREQVALPIYALGGMRLDDIATARSHGAQGIAAIRGLWPT